MSKNIVIGVIAVVILILVGWFLTRPKQTPVPTESTTSDSAPVESAAPSSASEGAAMKESTAVSITADGFSPTAITVILGGTVTWTNSDSGVHTVNSDPHPTHTNYPALNLGAIQPGSSKSLMFDKPGIYTYHDHLNPSLKGSVTVQ